MATVRMSGVLAKEILDNFKRQCETAYTNNNGIADFAQQIHTDLHDEQFYALIKQHEEYEKALTAYRDSKLSPKELKEASKGRYYSSNVDLPRRPFDVTNTFYFVINENRPDSENRTQIKQWRAEYTNRDNKKVDAKNWMPGDLPVAIKIQNGTHVVDDYGSKEFGYPFYYKPQKLSNWDQAEKYRDMLIDIQSPILITTPQDVATIQKLGEGDIKINEAVNKMTTYLGQLTTLKQFIDNWPGGSDLVPAEYMERFTKKTKRNTAPKDLPTLSEDLKSDINTAIFENKLTGE